MPQGPGTYGSKRGRPPKKSGFKLMSGNTTPFKQMGSSPLKQDYTEAVEHHKKYIKAKTSKVGNIANDPIHKEINRIAKGGKPQIDLIKAKKRAADATKVAKQGIWKGTKKVVGKVLPWALAAEAIYNAPKLAEKHGFRKFVGSMIWDENLLLSPSERKGGDHVKSEMEKEIEKATRYSPNLYSGPKY